MLAGRRLVIDRPHGLRWILESRVVSRDHRPRHDHGDLTPMPTLQERVVEGLRQQVADLALRLRAQHVEWRSRYHRGGHLRADRQEAHLRPVPVSDHDFGPTALGKCDQATRRRHEIAPLDLRRTRLAAPNQGVAAEGNRQPGHRMTLRVILMILRIMDDPADHLDGSSHPLPALLAGDEHVEQGLLGIPAVLGLVPDSRLRAVDHFVGHLVATVGRQAVQEDRPG